MCPPIYDGFYIVFLIQNTHDLRTILFPSTTPKTLAQIHLLLLCHCCVINVVSSSSERVTKFSSFSCLHKKIFIS